MRCISRTRVNWSGNQIDARGEVIEVDEPPEPCPEWLTFRERSNGRVREVTVDLVDRKAITIREGYSQGDAPLGDLTYLGESSRRAPIGFISDVGRAIAEMDPEDFPPGDGEVRTDGGQDVDEELKRELATDVGISSSGSERTCGADGLPGPKHVHGSGLLTSNSVDGPIATPPLTGDPNFEARTGINRRSTRWAIRVNAVTDYLNSPISPNWTFVTAFEADECILSWRGMRPILLGGHHIQSNPLHADNGVGSLIDEDLPPRSKLDNRSLNTGSSRDGGGA